MRALFTRRKGEITGMGMLSFFSFSRRLQIEGIMPERALLRLQRAKIPVYHVKKTQKNRLELSIKAKDIQKVFAIYPKMCYNSSGTSTYLVRDLGGEGLEKIIDFFKKRLAFVLGAAVFCILSLGIEPYVFGVKIVGTKVYEREILQTLETFGIRAFSKYKTGQEDEICAKLLACNGVEFCSVEKSGKIVVVEMRLSPFSKPKILQGDMLAKRSGKILSLAVLKGTPLKNVGDDVVAGEKLVGGYFCTPSGEYKGVEPIARVCVACTYEQDIQAMDEEQAFASAYLELGLSALDKITSRSIAQVSKKQPPQAEENHEQTKTTFHVKIEYICTETINF